MPWKHVGDARLAPSLSDDSLLIDIGDEDIYAVPVVGVRRAISGGRASLFRRYIAQDGTFREVEQGSQLRVSLSGAALSFVMEGRRYALNRFRTTEVLDGVTAAVRVMALIEDAAQLSDETGTQATLEAF